MNTMQTVEDAQEAATTHAYEAMIQENGGKSAPWKLEVQGGRSMVTLDHSFFRQFEEVRENVQKVTSGSRKPTGGSRTRDERYESQKYGE